MFDVTVSPMNVTTSSGSTTPNCAALLRVMAMRVSRSGGLHVRHKAPFEPRADTVFQLVHLHRRAVGRDDDLLSRFIERVERVEELLLRLLLTGDELDIVHQEKIGAAVFGAQILAAADLDGVDEIVREIVALDCIQSSPSDFCAWIALPMARRRCVLPSPELP